MTGPRVTRVLVRGAGDVGSAVAHRLFAAGYGVVLHDAPDPTVTRRGMAFVDALFDGDVTLDGLRAERVDDAERLPIVLAGRRAVPVTSLPSTASGARSTQPSWSMPGCASAPCPRRSAGWRR